MPETTTTTTTTMTTMTTTTTTTTTTETTTAPGTPVEFSVGHASGLPGETVEFRNGDLYINGRCMWGRIRVCPLLC